MKTQSNNRLWQGFWQIADPKIWIASTIPMAVGGALAYAQTGRFSWIWFVVGLVAIYCLEIGKNAINEYVDFLSGVDRFVAPDKRTPFSGGKKTIIDGKLTLKENLVIGLVTIVCGCILGLVVVFYRDFNILWFGLAGVFFALFYSLPPFQFAYRGLGELVVGFTFGPLITNGTYLVQTGTLNTLVILASLPLGLLIANVLWINQYPDYEADRQGGKRNWVVRLGKQKAGNIYTLLFSLAFLSFPLLTVYDRNYFWLLPLIGLPLAIRAIKVAREQHDNIPLLMEANAKTIQIYQLTGLMMVITALLTRITS